jgi:hypothetical protein
MRGDGVSELDSLVRPDELLSIFPSTIAEILCDFRKIEHSGRRSNVPGSITSRKTANSAEERGVDLNAAR